MNDPDNEDRVSLEKASDAATPPKGRAPLILGAVVGLGIIATGYAYTRPHAVHVATPVAAKPAEEQYVAPAKTAEEAADDEKLYRAEAMKEQVQELLCQETAQRYMKATTAIQLQRSIHISQANGCGWKYIMAADAKTHDLTPKALSAAGDIEEHDVPAVDGDDGERDATDSKLDEMNRKLSDQDAELSRLRYRSNYR